MIHTTHLHLICKLEENLLFVLILKGIQKFSSVN